MSCVPSIFASPIRVKGSDKHSAEASSRNIETQSSPSRNRASGSARSIFDLIGRSPVRRSKGSSKVASEPIPIERDRASTPRYPHPVELESTGSPLKSKSKPSPHTDRTKTPLSSDEETGSNSGTSVLESNKDDLPPLPPPIPRLGVREMHDFTTQPMRSTSKRTSMNLSESELSPKEGHSKPPRQRRAQAYVSRVAASYAKDRDSRTQSPPRSVSDINIEGLIETPPRTRTPSPKESFYELIPDGISPCVFEDVRGDENEAFLEAKGSRTMEDVFATINSFHKVAESDKEKQDVEDLRFRMMTLWLNDPTNPPQSVSEIVSRKVIPTKVTRERETIRFQEKTGLIIREKNWRILHTPQSSPLIVTNNPISGVSLGRGAFGIVRTAYEAQTPTGGQTVAIKKIHLPKADALKKRDVESFYTGYREWYIARKITEKTSTTEKSVLKPGPIYLYESNAWKPRQSHNSKRTPMTGYVLAFTTPLANIEHAKAPQNITQKDRLMMLRQAARAAQTCHKKGFAHGDIKLENMAHTGVSFSLLDTGAAYPLCNPEKLPKTLRTLHYNPRQFGGTYPSEFGREIRVESESLNADTYPGREDVYALVQMACFTLGIQDVFDFCQSNTKLGSKYCYHDNNDMYSRFPEERNKTTTEKLPRNERLSYSQKCQLQNLIDVCLKEPGTTIDKFMELLPKN